MIWPAVIAILLLFFALSWWYYDTQYDPTGNFGDPVTPAIATVIALAGIRLAAWVLLGWWLK